MSHWCIYNRHDSRAAWRLVVVLPPEMRRDQVNQIIGYTNIVLEKEHRLQWLVLQIDPYEETIPDHIWEQQEPYRG